MAQWRILVVDDEPMNLEIIGDVLDDPSFVVSNAANGEIAWQAMQAAETLPQLLVLDRMMPVLDGIELLKRIKAEPRFADIPVIMQSAASSSSDIAEGVAAGAWYYLPKPYAPRDLLAIVRAALEEVAEREAANQVVRNRRSVLDLLDVAEFEFRTLKQAAELSGLSYSHLRLLARRSDIWAIRLGNSWFTTAEAVTAYASEVHNPGPKPGTNKKSNSEDA